MTNATLSRNDLRQTVPSVFATTPWEGMSESYRFIPTADVLDMLDRSGLPGHVSPAEPHPHRGQGPFTKHMLRLRHESVMDAQGEVPEVVLINSHDRSSAYRVFSGVFRLVCENGMIVQSADFGSFSIRHSGSRDLFQQVRDATSQIMEGVPTIMNRIADLEGDHPAPARQVEFAREAWTSSRTTPSRPSGCSPPAATRT